MILCSILKNHTEWCTIFSIIIFGMKEGAMVLVNLYEPVWGVLDMTIWLFDTPERSVTEKSCLYSAVAQERGNYGISYS